MSYDCSVRKSQDRDGGVVFDTRRLLGGVLAAGLLAVLPAPALAATPRVAFSFSFGQRCSEEWQLVDYALVFYLQSPSEQAKEQLSHELSVDLRRAATECGAP
jgi:hypothetical protein